jgi:hypothetical protein
MSRNDISRDFTAVTGRNFAEGGDHARQRKQAAIRGDNLEEIARERTDFRLIAQGNHGSRLLVGRKDRARNEPLQIIAHLDHRLETVEIGSDCINRTSLKRKVEQRRRIALGNSRNPLGCVCHGHKIP